MHKFIKVFLILTLFSFYQLSYSDNYNYLGVGTAKIEDLDGPMLDFSIGPAGSIFTHGRGYFMSEEGININIYTVGLGYGWQNEQADLSIEAGYASGYAWAGLCYGSYCASADYKTSGYYVEAAVRGWDETGLAYKFSVGQMDLDGSGTFYTGDLIYNFNESWGASLGFVSLDGDNGPNFLIRYSW